ncbi:c-type cytochrome [Devosia sp.]|uniref:c-type cytochrome n=1 Tax=Devosia sp. TaxID=1871048 RepID=UPI003A8FE911
MRVRTPLAILGLAPLLAAPVTAGEPGEQLFVDNCSGCHQLGGVGQPGLAPPLVDPELWAGLGDKAPNYLVGVLFGGLTGQITAQGQVYIGVAMPPQSWMTDEELQLVADYVLQDLNDLEVAVDPALIETTRAAPPSHADLRETRRSAMP